MSVRGASERETIELARRSPNAFAIWMKGWRQGVCHGTIQDHWTDHANSYAECHRGMGKTEQLSLREIWDIGHDQSLRIKYVQQTDKESRKTVGAMKEMIESDRYAKVFPWVEPDREQWGREAFKVKTPRYQRDPTAEACGIFGHAGGRADHLIADDVCDLENAVRKPTLREQAKEAWANTWRRMLDTSRDKPPRERKIGTPYHVDDITAGWRDYHTGKGSLLRMPVLGFQSPWPEAFPEQLLRDYRAEDGPTAYARAYELIPLSAEDLFFTPEWLTDSFFEELPSGAHVGGQVVTTVDLAFTEKKQKNRPDWSAALIGLRTANGHVYVTDLVHMQAQLPDFERAAHAAWRAHNVERGTVEANGPQKEIARQMNDRASIPLVPLQRSVDKITRAADKQAFVEAGKFHIMARRTTSGGLEPIPALQPLYDEMTTFPAGGNDDTVDCALDMMDLAKAPRRSGDRARVKRPRGLQTIYGASR